MPRCSALKAIGAWLREWKLARSPAVSTPRAQDKTETLAGASSLQGSLEFSDDIDPDIHSGSDTGAGPILPTGGFGSGSR